MPLDINHLQCSQWRQAIQLGDFQRGKAYCAQGRSSVLQVQGATITAQCKGSAGQTYLQTITLLAKEQHYDINGRCSCYVSYNCKHVVAALLTLEQLQQQGTAPRTLPSAPQAQSPAQPTQTLKIIDAPQQQPTPQLTLGSVAVERYDARTKRMYSTQQHRAALAFDYQGHLCVGKPAAEFIAHTGPYQRLRIMRDLAFEQACRQQLLKLGLQIALRRSDAVPETAGDAYELISDSAWLSFMQHHNAPLFFT